nr:DNA replication terminus site-binding [Ipomoea batatas]
MEGSQDDNPVELQDNDFFFVPTQSSGAREMNSTKRKRKRSDTCEPITADSLLGAAMMLSEKLESVGDKISKSLGTELTLQQKIEQLEGKLSEIEGLEYDCKFMALIKLPEYPNQMLVFFSLAADQRLEWVKRSPSSILTFSSPLLPSTMRRCFNFVAAGQQWEAVGLQLGEGICYIRNGLWVGGGLEMGYGLVA